MLSLEKILELLSDRTDGELAKLAAYLLAPLLVFVLAFSGVYTPGIALDFAKPLAVSHLQTEVTADGKVTQRRGIALLMEPVESEYRIPLDTGSTMWVSLDEQAMRANADRLVLSASGLNGRSPLIGVNTPVTVVVQGAPGKEILVPGGTERLEDWAVQSRRSVSLVSSALLACVFAFGVSLATGLPPAKGDQNAGGEQRAKKDEKEVVHRYAIHGQPWIVRITPDPELDREEVPGIGDQRDQECDPACEAEVSPAGGAREQPE